MRRVLLNILAAALSVIVAIAGTEVITRYVRDDVRFDFMAQQDVETAVVDGVELWRERHPRFSPEDIRNAASHRDAFTILGLGDSIMYGSGVTKEQTYLEETRQRLARGTTREVQVLNLAVEGYNTMQENAVYKEIDSQIQPDLVLVHYWENDVYQYRFVGGYVVNSGDISDDGHLVVRALPLPPRLNDFLLIHSRLYALMSRSVVAYQDLIKPADWNRVTEPLAQIHERAQRAHGRLIVLASARLNEETAKPTYDLPKLQQFASGRGIEVIDLSEWLRGIDVASIAMDGCHFNAAGHRLIGERLAAHLLEHDLKAVN